VSDFLFSSARRSRGELEAAIRGIRHRNQPDVWEYHGVWGSLAVGRGHYNGFEPVETSTHICVVIGGPVLCFRDNLFLNGGGRQIGTRAILERVLSGDIDWDEDLSGPFVVLLVDKVRAMARCLTDLMMFIPVYEHHHEGRLVIGTHVDAVAAASGRQTDLDEISIVDFILHDVVTFPYTAYREVRQLYPAAEHTYASAGEGRVEKSGPRVYWEPAEWRAFARIGEAAEALRSGLRTHVDRIVGGMSHVAQFISGGEDSRAIAGLLPAGIQRDAYIFLDSMNREGRVAERVAKAYGAAFYPNYRSATHYLDILEEAGSLVGLGHKYSHAHSLGFHEKCGLNRYPAVFGGYLSDTLLKGVYARKPRVSEQFPFLPQIALPGETRSGPVNARGFQPELIKEVEYRRRDHLERVQAIRFRTAHEWFVLWPMTMRATIPNFYSTRRLFASYEPFMAAVVVKVSAVVPTRWKLNRRLFWHMARPWLEPARAVRTGDGRFPHLPWPANVPVQGAVWFGRQIVRQFGDSKCNEGPWGDWEAVSRSAAWQDRVGELSQSTLILRLTAGRTARDVEGMFVSLPRQSQVNLLQVAVALEQVNGWSCQENLALSAGCLR
jgi:hypothetical protein